MTDPRPAVIFGGGAALGAHQVGAMRYLEEIGVRPALVVGSSIGVINGMAWLSGGLENLAAMWGKIVSLPHMLRPSFRHNPLLGHSFFKVEPFYALIEDYFDYERAWKSSVDFAFILTNLTQCREEIHSNRSVETLEDFKTVVRAAFTIPLLYPLVKWRGQEWCDGGFGWNVPLEYVLDQKADAIYVLTAISTRLPEQKNVGRNVLTVLLRFLSLLWRNAGNNSVLNARLVDGRFHGIPTFVVNPREEHSGFQHIHLLNAYPSKSRKLMEDGYEDARAQLERQRRRADRVRSASGKRPH